MTVRHLNPDELAERWNLSARTLERWRWLKKGPPFLKVGGRVVYRLEDVESYEASQVQRPSGLRERSDSPGAPERDG